MFINALVAHLLGDWLLQNSWMTKNKRESRKVLVVHVLVTALPFVVFGFSLGQIIMIAITHLLIDGFQLGSLWNRLFKKDDYLFVKAMDDQALHVLSIWIVLYLVP